MNDQKVIELCIKESDRIMYQILEILKTLNKHVHSKDEALRDKALMTIGALNEFINVDHGLLAWVDKAEITINSSNKGT